MVAVRNQALRAGLLAHIDFITGHEIVDADAEESACRRKGNIAQFSGLAAQCVRQNLQSHVEDEYSNKDCQNMFHLFAGQLQFVRTVPGYHQSDKYHTGHEGIGHGVPCVGCKADAP